jgi:hypothetical protein
MTGPMMMRRILLGALVAASWLGCQTASAPASDPGSPTGTVEQASSSFCGATLPPLIPFVAGQTVIAVAPSLTNSGYVVVQDWVHGGFIAGLADLGQGKVTAAYSLTANTLPLFMYYETYRGRISVGNPPPPPNPVGEDGLARFLLEYELSITGASKDANYRATTCP